MSNRRDKRKRNQAQKMKSDALERKRKKKPVKKSKVGTLEEQALRRKYDGIANCWKCGREFQIPAWIRDNTGSNNSVSFRCQCGEKNTVTL